MSEERTIHSGDAQTHTWAKLKKHIGAEIEKLRARNDSDLDPIKTAALRGEIKALKNLLALETDQATVVNED